MYLNNSTPEPTLNPIRQNPNLSAKPDYTNLVRFLIEPFLETPESLRVDCERSLAQQRIWIRLAFNTEDKGRVYGRGGRNIQAIRTVLSAIAQAAGESVYLDIYESQSNGERPRVSPSRPSPRRTRTRHRPSTSRRLARKPER
ncbi:MAG: KH domain-containing protein [Cyanobacteria bacterium J06592_8]